MDVKTKNIKRLWLIIQNVLRFLSGSFTTLIISFLVIKFSSPELWGKFVQILVTLGILNMILGWGSKEYMLRAFSLRPKNILFDWYSNTWTRCIFLPFCICIVVYLWALPLSIWIVLWMILRLSIDSFEPLIIYFNRFSTVIISNVLFLFGAIAYLYCHSTNINTLHIIQLFIVGHIFKLLLLLFDFRRIIFESFNFKFDFNFYKTGFSFFILAASGLLGSNIDLYLVNYFQSYTDLGTYQIAISYFIKIQAVASFILVPFLKYLYRFNVKKIWKISIYLGLIGFLLVPVGLSVCYYLLNLYLNLNLPVLFFIISFFYIIPVYFYLPLVYHFYKMKQEQKVLIINFISIGINVFLNIIFIQYYGIVGALLASAIASLSIWFMYLYVLKNKAYAMS